MGGFNELFDDLLEEVLDDLDEDGQPRFDADLDTGIDYGSDAPVPVFAYLDPQGNEIEQYMARNYRKENYFHTEYKSSELRLILKSLSLVITNGQPKSEWGIFVVAESVGLSAFVEKKFTTKSAALEEYQDILLSKTQSYFEEDGTFIEIGNSLRDSYDFNKTDKPKALKGMEDSLSSW